jgi:hypothetical protein
MKTFYNTLTTAALTVLLYIGTPGGPALANLSVDTPISSADNVQTAATTPATPSLSGLQAMDLGMPSMPPLPNEPKQRYKMVDAGGTAVCAIRAGGNGIDCYGFDQLQQAEPPKGQFESLSMGQFHGCALSKVGKMSCWGDPEAYPTPEESGNKRYKLLSAGTDHTCALGHRGGLTCWGNNDFGELNVPPGQYLDVSAKSDHTCAIDKGHNLLCWGDQAFTSYGPFTGQYTDVSTGNLHVCALRKSDKRAVCWGNNAYGQATPPMDEFVSLTSGSYHTCGQRADKTASCWGKNDYGQAEQDGRRFAQISAGGNLTCVLIQGSRRLACQGSFAFNDDLFKSSTGDREAALSRSGVVRPQSSLDSWLSGGLDWFGSSLSDGLETFFDPDLKGFVKAAKFGNIGFGLASFLISNLLGEEDPNEARFKEIQQQLADIKVSLTEISAAIQTLNTMLASTNYMVAANWCDAAIDPLAKVEKDVRIGISYKGPIGNWRILMDDYQKYLNELETLKKTSLETKQPIDQAILDQKLTALLAKVDQFKKDWLSKEPNGKNIERMRHDLTKMLLGETLTSPLEACKAKSFQAWKSSPNLYPFDDRPIWAEASKVFIKSMNIQDQIADIETGVNAFDMMRVFQAPMKDAQGNPIPVYQWEPKEGEQGVCKLAENSPGANPRLKAVWGTERDKGPCQVHQDIVKDIYLGQVQQFEAMGGAYSDDNVVLSMTSQQMGANPSADNQGQSNWLWFRSVENGAVKEAFSGMQKEERNDPAYHPSYNKKWTAGISNYKAQMSSPFNNVLPKDLNGNDDYREYLTTTSSDTNAARFFVWHSNGQAWRDAFQARADIKNARANEKDRYEDFMATMAAIKDPVKNVTAFPGLSKKPFWALNNDGSVFPELFDIRLRSPGNSSLPSPGYYRKKALPCFMAENINDGRNADGGMDGHSWYHPNINDESYDESKRQYLKLSGKVCGSEEFTALLRTNATLEWKEGIDCSWYHRCWGLAPIFAKNPKFDQYKDYFGGNYRLIYENNLRGDRKFEAVWGLKGIIDKMDLYHLPVVKISGMPCNQKVVADNIERIWLGMDKNPVYSLRSGERSTGDGKTTVPSVCGNNMDRMSTCPAYGIYRRSKYQSALVA